MFEFMEECSNSKCDNATSALAGAITGEAGLFPCDMMDYLYRGDPDGGYYYGWRDNVTSKAAYLLSLVNMGVTVQTAYVTLATQDENAYKSVQTLYGSTLVKAGKRI